MDDQPLPDDLADQSVRQAIRLLQDNAITLEANFRASGDKLREAVRLQLRRWELDRDYDALRAALGALLAGEEAALGSALRQDLALDNQINSAREAIDRMTRDGAAAPAAAAARPPSGYRGIDAELIRGALIKLKLLTPGAPLYPPHGSATGKSGASRVYFLRLPAPHGPASNPYGISLVAKCDAPERARRECERIENLRHLGVPPSVQLPSNLLTAVEDQVLIYQSHGSADSLENFLRGQLLSPRPNWEKAIELTFSPDTLGWFYTNVPGALREFRHADPIRWKEFFDELSEPYDELLRAAAAAWPHVDWAKDDTFRVPEVLGERDLLNPFPRLGTLLKGPTGPVWLSLVHGDLNLTNVLIDRSLSFGPASILLIDFTFTEPDRLTAKDFACFEAEFWKEVYVSLVQTSGADPDRGLRDFVTVRDYLDGRSSAKPSPQSKLPSEALNLVRRVRHYAHQALSRDPRYLLRDLFHGLLFGPISSLRFPTTRENPNKVKIALLGAALSLDVIIDQDDKRYDKPIRNGRLPLRRGNRGRGGAAHS